MKQETYQKKVVRDLHFVPYEDFLGIGSEKGAEKVLVLRWINFLK